MEILEISLLNVIFGLLNPKFLVSTTNSSRNLPKNSCLCIIFFTRQKCLETLKVDKICNKNGPMTFWRRTNGCRRANAPGTRDAPGIERSHTELVTAFRDIYCWTRAPSPTSWQTTVWCPKRATLSCVKRGRCKFKLFHLRAFVISWQNSERDGTNSKTT